MSSLSVLFDEKYEELKETIPEDMNAFDKLIFLNQEVFEMIENRIALDLLAKLYSIQLVSQTERSLLDYNRLYYRLIRKIVFDGQERGEITRGISVNEIVKIYAMLERALLYDWCICNGEYSLRTYAKNVMEMTLASIRL
ncbi:MAG: TetR/AcrR family transcriptional regulator C-terminal domain-containing protein, partial [Clostridiaceae bacterium]